MRLHRNRLAVALTTLIVLASPALPVGSGPATPVPASTGPSPQVVARPDAPRFLTGFVPDPWDSTRSFEAPMPAGVTTQMLPSRLDWRQNGKVSPVKDQGGCPACWAFAAVAAFESRLLMDGAGLFDISENSAKDCVWSGQPAGAQEPAVALGGCHNGNPFDVLNLFSQQGSVLETCDPYVQSDAPCNATCPRRHTLLGYRHVMYTERPDVNVLKAYLWTHGPLICGLNVAGDPNFYAEMGSYDGSYTLYRPGTFEVDHMVLIIGWDDHLLPRGSSVPGAWIVKNSWGPNWGGTCGHGRERGYFTIGYDSAGIGSFALALEDWQDYDAQGGILYYDEAGKDTLIEQLGATGWGLARLTPPQAGAASRVEFFTQDATTDIDIHIYDEYNAETGILSRPLASAENAHFDTPGYFSVPLPRTVPLRAGDDVIVAVRFTTAMPKCPVPLDTKGTLQTGRTYFSPSGAPGTWVDTALQFNGNVNIRLRYSGANAQPTRTPTVTPGALRPRAYLPVTLLGR
jgi:C1A family cysteine protease